MYLDIDLDQYPSPQELPLWFPKWICEFAHSTAIDECCLTPHLCQKELLSAILLSLPILTDVSSNIKLVLICIFLMTKDREHFIKCLLFEFLILRILCLKPSLVWWCLLLIQELQHLACRGRHTSEFKAVNIYWVSSRTIRRQTKTKKSVTHLLNYLF